jgi:hypothetical protein
MEAAQGGPDFDHGIAVIDRDMLDLRTGPGWIYFIVPARMNQVKIGWSLNPLERLKILQTGQSAVLRIFAVVPGTQDQEYLLHRIFADSRIRGEWFDWRSLRARIEALANAKGFIANNTPRYRKSRNSPEPKSGMHFLRVYIKG